MEYKIKRNSDETLAENCKVNIGVKIGSFDCTANCPHNQNTKKEIQEQMKTLAEENFEAMKEIIGDADMKMIIDERRNVFQENMPSSTQYLHLKEQKKI